MYLSTQKTAGYKKVIMTIRKTNFTMEKYETNINIFCDKYDVILTRPARKLIMH